jgi:hypothetical protein
MTVLIEAIHDQSFLSSQHQHQGMQTPLRGGRGGVLLRPAGVIKAIPVLNWLPDI